MWLPIISLVVFVVSFPPVGFWFLGFVALAPFFLFLVREKRFFRLVLGTISFRFTSGAVVLYCGFEPMLFLYGAFLFLGLPVSLFIIKKLFERRLPLEKLQYLTICSLPFLWVFWDFFSAQFSFLPNFVFMAGNILGSSPFIGLARWGGIMGLTFFIACSNALIVFALLSGNKRALWQSFGQGIPFKKIVSEGKHTMGILSLGAFLLLLVVGWITSRYLLSKAEDVYNARANAMRVIIVSTNDAMDEIFSRLGSDASGELIKQSIPFLGQVSEIQPGDLIVLPENMIVEEYGNVDHEAKNKFGIENQGSLIAAYRGVAIDSETPLLGTFTTIQGGKRYKTAILFGENGEILQIYNKSRLTFISEFWPFGSWRPFYFDWIKDQNPEIAEESPVFDSRYRYGYGDKKILTLYNAKFGTPICLEVHYPYDLKEFKNLGAEFFIHTSNNKWVRYGLNTYLSLTNNLRKIESVWLNVPIIINGRYEKAGVITPDGREDFVDFQSPGKNYGIWEGTVRY